MQTSEAISIDLDSVTTDPVAPLTSAPPAACPNCTGPAPGPYCAACGMRQGELKPTFRELLRHAAGEFLHVDRKLGRSLAYLLFRPGFLVHEYFAGRRLQYLSPLKLYLVCSAIHFLLLALFPMHTPVQVRDAATNKVRVEFRYLRFEDAMELSAQAGVDARNGNGAEEIRALQGRFRQSLSSSLPTQTLLCVPSFAYFLGLAFRRPGRRYVEDLVTSTHSIAAALILLLLVFVPGPALLLYGLGTGLWMAYTCVLTKNVYRRGWLRAGAGTLAATALQSVATFIQLAIFGLLQLAYLSLTK